MTSAPTQLEGARLIDQIMKEVEKEQAQRWNAFGLRHEVDKTGIERSQSLRNLQPGHRCLFIAPSARAGKDHINSFKLTDKWFLSKQIVHEKFSFLLYETISQFNDE